MTSAPRGRILEILAAVREQPETQRRAFLDSACSGDALLREEVEQLLSADDFEDSATIAPDSMARTELPPADSPRAGETSHGGSKPPAFLREGTMVGPYEVEERVGCGGMGVVYKARDTRLGRNVAIKIIQSESSNPQLEAALLREARLASSLNHPGIVTIYDILVYGGSMCIVMEFVLGSPLHAVIPEGGFPMERALALALAIGDAIAVAHAAGVIHRDLKPANILVRDDGQIKILDFGLARISPRRATDEEEVSIFSGNMVGTIGYMAPEQARAEEVDERADIFSFGVILSQLLTGKRPFQGANATALLYAMQTAEPVSLRVANPEIPYALEHVVRRALAKVIDQRYQTIREMLTDLSTVATVKSEIASSIALPAPVPAARTIAVLPLINLSPNPENEYICDGVSEELIDGLTQIEGLRVVSRSSSFQFKGTTPDAREIGLRLGAKLLVHGSLRRSGESLRLNMQLSEADEGYQIWSQRFDAQVGDLFALQDQLTAAVLEKLREQLGTRFAEVEGGRHMPAAEAYDLYLQARFAFNRETPSQFRQALELFERSAAADPEFAPAFLGIAETHMRLDWYGVEEAAVAAPAVKSALAIALRLDPNSVAGLCNLALMQAGWDWNWKAAGSTFKRALLAGEGSATVHFHYGLDYLTPQGKLDQALRQLRYALQLDPLSPIVKTAVGGCLYRMKKWNESEEILCSTLQANPGFGHAHWSLGRALLEQSRFDEALSQFEDAAKIMGNIPAALSELGYCYARMGRSERARITIQEIQEQEGWVSPLSVALVDVGLGERDAAMDQLEDAFEKRIRQLVWVNVDPRYDALRDHPGFEPLIAKLGLRPPTN
jgi:serine/threonine protein kinase/Tfp pilus assembly protein PilF